MIFRQALTRELNQIAGAVFVTLFTIMLTTQSIRLLGQAAGGKLASEAVLALLGFSALGYLPVLLSLTVFVSILLTLSRQYRDSEMVVWFASGQSLTAWIRPALSFALPFVLMIAALSLLASPWAASSSERYKEGLDARGDAARITPGAFKESARGNRVFFVESNAAVTQSSPPRRESSQVRRRVPFGVYRFLESAKEAICHHAQSCLAAPAMKLAQCDVLCLLTLWCVRLPNRVQQFAKRFIAAQ